MQCINVLYTTFRRAIHSISYYVSYVVFFMCKIMFILM